MKVCQFAVTTLIFSSLPTFGTAAPLKGSSNKSLDTEPVPVPRSLKNRPVTKRKRKKVVGPKRGAGVMSVDIDADRSEVELDFSEFPLDVSPEFDDEIQLQFVSGGPVFTFSLTMVDNDDEPFTMYTGENAETGDTIYLTVGVTPQGEESLSGSVQSFSDGKTYQIRRIGDNTFVADIVSKFPNENFLVAEVPVDEEIVLEPLGADGRRLQGEVEEIDVMVLYSREALCGAAAVDASSCVPALHSRGIESIIQTSVAETNIGYRESEIDLRMRLVHTEMVEYTEPSSFSTNLNDLTFGTNGLEGVAALRNQYGADFVVFLRHNGGCGIAWVPSSPNAAYAFSVTAWDCATGHFTFGHEIGHNFGCYHDRADHGKPLEEDGDYFYAYQDQAETFRTVLSYTCPGGCNRVNRYSNPNVLWNGVPTGVSWADNARYINERVTSYRDFRTAVVPYAPTSAPVVPVGGIETLRKYYLESEPVDMQYDYGSSVAPGPNDVVSIYASGSATRLVYRWTCGFSYHVCAEGETLAAPADFQNLVGNWPISVGTYVATLDQNSGATRVFTSADFFVIAQHAATLQLDSTVYDFDEPIEAIITNTNPLADDFVAVLPSGASSPLTETDALLWLKAACADQSCSSADRVYDNVMTFGAGGADEIGLEQWPLAEGDYEMVLVSEGSIIASKVFAVLSSGTAAPVTPSPVTPAPVLVTPAPITPAPVTPAPVLVTPAPITPAPVTPAPATPAPVVAQADDLIFWILLPNPNGGVSDPNGEFIQLKNPTNQLIDFALEQYQVCRVRSNLCTTLTGTVDAFGTYELCRNANFYVACDVQGNFGMRNRPTTDTILLKKEDSAGSMVDIDSVQYGDPRTPNGGLCWTREDNQADSDYSYETCPTL